MTKLSMIASIATMFGGNDLFAKANTATTPKVNHKKRVPATKGQKNKSQRMRSNRSKAKKCS